MSSDTEMRAGDFIAIAAGLVFLVACGVVATRAQSWTDGFCAALGGERITNYTCDVHGKVVHA